MTCIHIFYNYVHVEDMGVGARNIVANFEVGPEVNTLTRSYLIRDQDGQSDVAKRLDSKPHLQISQRGGSMWCIQCMLSKKMESTTYLVDCCLNLSRARKCFIGK